MKLQLLRQVKDAEDAGATVVADAEAQAERIVKDARKNAEQAIVDGKSQADQARQTLLDTARAEVKAEAEKIIADGQAKAKALREGFDAGVEGVTDRVLKIIEESF